jgi:hypothetical protein
MRGDLGSGELLRKRPRIAVMSRPNRIGCRRAERRSPPTEKTLHAYGNVEPILRVIPYEPSASRQSYRELAPIQFVSRQRSSLGMRIHGDEHGNAQRGGLRLLPPQNLTLPLDPAAGVASADGGSALLMSC